VPSYQGTIFVRVYHGGYMGEQLIPFKAAWDQLNLPDQYIIEYINVDEIKVVK
jgi:hypothetical protein